MLQPLIGIRSFALDRGAMMDLCFFVLVSGLLLLVLLLPKRKALLLRRVLVCLLLGAFALGQPIFSLEYDQLRQAHVNAEQYMYTAAYTRQLYSIDASLAVETPDGYSGDYIKVKLHFTDHRTQHMAVQSFARLVQPIAFEGRAAVILAQQQPDESRITLLRWNLDANTTETLGSIPCHRGTLAKMMMSLPDAKCAVMSPDERNLLIILPSRYNSNAVDLWCLDLQQRSTHLLKPAVYTNSTAFCCRNDGVVFSSANRLLHVDFATKRETSLPLPAHEEVRP